MLTGCMLYWAKLLHTKISQERVPASTSLSSNSISNGASIQCHIMGVSDMPPALTCLSSFSSAYSGACSVHGSMPNFSDCFSRSASAVETVACSVVMKKRLSWSGKL